MDWSKVGSLGDFLTTKVGYLPNFGPCVDVLLLAFINPSPSFMEQALRRTIAIRTRKFKRHLAVAGASAVVGAILLAILVWFVLEVERNKPWTDNVVRVYPKLVRCPIGNLVVDAKGCTYFDFEGNAAAVNVMINWWCTVEGYFASGSSLSNSQSQSPPPQPLYTRKLTGQCGCFVISCNTVKFCGFFAECWLRGMLLVSGLRRFVDADRAGHD